jgi:hypothetical protein
MDVEADLLIALRKIAGVPEGDAFTICEADVSFAVDYKGGSFSHLTLRALYNPREPSYRSNARWDAITAVRPMSIVLRAEKTSDRDAKAEGINREYQTGDEAFDSGVYVDSPTTDEAVLGAVLNDMVRAAAMDLVLLGFEDVTIDDGNRQVSAWISGFRHLGAPDEAASRIVRAFANLLRGLPPVREAAGRHPRRSILPAVSVWAGLMLALPFGLGAFFGVADSHNCLDTNGLKSECGGLVPPFAVAIVAGAIACGVARAVARRRMTGDSDSSTRVSYVSWAAFIWIACVTLVVSAAVYYGCR